MTDSSQGTTTYGYDQDSRLTSEVGPGVNNTYTYDKVGNRVGLNSQSFSYDTDDRNAAETYDANGNVVKPREEGSHLTA